MKKLGKIIFVCFLCIGMINSNEGTLRADEGDTFTADIEIGGQAVVTTFKVLSEESGSTKGTVQIGNGWDAAIAINTAGDMVIPEIVGNSSTGNSYDVTKIGNYAFMDCTSLTSIGLESNNTVVGIGRESFAGCTSLTSTGLESNSTVTGIGFNAFRDCTSLTSTGLESNTSVIEIWDGAFARCTSLTSTGLESNTTVTEIGYDAFTGCTALISTGLESNNTVTDIGWYAFMDCTSLTNTGLSADSKVPDIGRYAFSDCTNLASFIFKNNSIPTIGFNAFPSDIETYYFEGATGIDNLSGYNATEIKVDSIKVVDKTYHEGETFTPNGLKFRIGYSKTSGTAEEVSDIVDYNNSKNEFKVNEVLLKSGINKIDVEYLNEQVTLRLDVEAHTYGKWFIDKEATISEDGEKHTLCSECNNKKIDSIPMIDESSYAITSGSNQTWQKGSKNTINFTIDAKIENFEGIKIDGKTINKELYIVKSGSTIIELKTEYLNTLNKGNYKIVFLFKGNEVATSFKVIETAVIDNKIPDTGDQTNISVYIGMMILALGSYIWLKKGRN